MIKEKLPQNVSINDANKTPAIHAPTAIGILLNLFCGINLINKKVIIIGDFNSNSIWDKWDRWWNHSDVINELKELNIISLYHEKFNEKQGKESKPTFYLQRKIEKPYHIDYIFLSQQLINDKTILEIGDKDYWLKNSDHLPLFIDL